MKKTILAAAVACVAAVSFSMPASADSLKIVVKPKVPVVKKVVVIRKPCYYKTVKVIKNRKTIITKTRVCP